MLTIARGVRLSRRDSLKKTEHHWRHNMLKEFLLASVFCDDLTAELALRGAFLQELLTDLRYKGFGDDIIEFIHSSRLDWRLHGGRFPGYHIYLVGPSFLVTPTVEAFFFAYYVGDCGFPYFKRNYMKALKKV
jgi:hypothetical protein